MSRERFEEDCADCRPIIFDTTTGKKFGPETPEGKAVDEVWKGTKRRERVAFHNATCKNSRAPRDMELMEALMAKIGEAIKRAKDVRPALMARIGDAIKKAKDVRPPS